MPRKKAGLMEDLDVVFMVLFKPERALKTSLGGRVTVSCKQIRNDLRCCSDLEALRAA